jgi:D-sedoheptulose 7-phosphate isomerase
MLQPVERMRRNLDAAIGAKQQLLGDQGALDAFARVAEVVIACYRAGGRLYIAGNGGSAADAQHLAAEFVSRLAHDRAPLPAEALTTDSSILTAIGNDYGFEQVFSRQLAGKARAGDVFLGITTSGESPNILRALETCRRIGIPGIVLTGRSGGAARALADHCLIAPGRATSTIQELHIVMAHTLCECVEAALFPEAAGQA